MTFESINPHLPSDVVGEFEAAGPEGVEGAVGRAREAFFEWREQPASARGSTRSLLPLGGASLHFLLVSLLARIPQPDHLSGGKARSLRSPRRPTHKICATWLEQS